MRVESKITSQGQVSVPALIRRKLGLAPGSTIEWCDQGEYVLVRRASRYTFKDIHDMLFATEPQPRSISDFDQGIRDLMRRKHARN